MKLRRAFLAGIGAVLLLAGVLIARPGVALAGEIEQAGVEAQLSDAPVVHVVQKGETLGAIASRYGTTVQTLMKQNSLRNPNRVDVGQRLIVRAGEVTSAGSGVHVVRRGQTLSGIAKQYGATVNALKQANNLRSDTVFVGQRLRLPSAAGAGDASAGASAIYTVLAGDTLSSIAAENGISVERLAKLNGISSNSLVKVGQQLRVSGDTPAPADRRGRKKIVVDISEQRCWRFQGDKLLNTWRCSTARKGYGTRTGTFRVQSKLRKAYGSTWNIWMPYWLGIYWSGRVENGIHGLPWNAKTGGRTWAGLVGTPITYGCVMLNDTAMKTVWEWADIGTTVVIKR